MEIEPLPATGERPLSAVSDGDPALDAANLEVLAGELASARAQLAERQAALKTACAENADFDEQLESARIEVARQQQAVSSLRAEVAAMKSSRLWRLGTWIQKPATLARRLRSNAGRFYAKHLDRPVEDAQVLRKAQLVDAAWYCAQHPEARLNPKQAVMHYLKVGAALGWEPNRLFDTRWYLAQNEDVRQSGRNPAVHYATIGWRQGRNPHPAFDVKWYLENYPDVVAADVEPTVHYLKYGWREHRSPHPLADASSDVRVLESIRPWFDADYYASQNPEVATAGMDPLEHYHFCGESEGRCPRADFDPVFYVAANADVRHSELWSGHPFYHFILCGRSEGRSGKAFLAPVRLDDSDAAPDLARGAIGVALHLYYPDIWDVIRDVLAKLPPEARLYVSLVEERSDHLAETILADYPTARIQVVQNRGRDVAPFLKQLRAMQEDGVEVALKIHGKKTMSSGTEYGIAWRDALYEDLAPSRGQVNAILRLFQSDVDAGIVIPDGHYASLRRGLQFNRAELFRLAAAVGASLPPESIATTPFPAGTMFWFRPAALAGLSRLQLKTSDFPDEEGQTDGTLAHAIERIICIAASAEGYTTVAYRCPNRRGLPASSPAVRSQGVWRKVRLERKYPGITRPQGLGRTEHFTTLTRDPSITRCPGRARPRMNFVVQTLDPDIMYGGYIAGLEFAAAMNRHVDIRFVPIVHPLSNLQALYDMFRGNARVAPMLERAEWANLCKPGDELSVGKSDFFCAFSSWDCLLATKLARACGQSGFIYFCQEDESCFHHHDAQHAIVRQAQQFPQFTIFNTSLLREHFRANRLGVYARSEEEAERNSAVFEHALSPVAPPSMQDCRARTKTRILVYTRPENHAGRNLFEFAMLGLREFLRAALPAMDEIEIVGVGTLSYEAIVPLCNGHGIRIIPRLELQSYAETLAGFDIGLSLMYAPHPGLMHFEMASAGMLVVTNTFGVRTRDRLASLSPNLIPVDATVEGVAAGLMDAWRRRNDFEGRIRGAAVNWNRSWDHAFDDLISRLNPRIAAWLDESAALQPERALP